MKFYDSFKHFATTLSIQYRLKFRSFITNVNKIYNRMYEQYLEWDDESIITSVRTRNKYRTTANEYSFNEHGNPYFIVPSNLPININGNEIKSSDDVLNLGEQEEINLQVKNMTDEFIKELPHLFDDFEASRTIEKQKIIDEYVKSHNKPITLDNIYGKITPTMAHDLVEHLIKAGVCVEGDREIQIAEIFNWSTKKYNEAYREYFKFPENKDNILSVKVAAKKKPKKRPAPTTTKKKSNRKAKK